MPNSARYCCKWLTQNNSFHFYELPYELSIILNPIYNLGS